MRMPADFYILLPDDLVESNGKEVRGQAQAEDSRVPRTGRDPDGAGTALAAVLPHFARERSARPLPSFLNRRDHRADAQAAAAMGTRTFLNRVFRGQLHSLPAGGTDAGVVMNDLALAQQLLQRGLDAPARLDRRHRQGCAVEA